MREPTPTTTTCLRSLGLGSNGMRRCAAAYIQGSTAAPIFSIGLPVLVVHPGRKGLVVKCRWWKSHTTIAMFMVIIYVFLCIGNNAR